MREMQKATPLARHLTAYFLRNDVGLSAHFKEELETYLRGIAGALGVVVKKIEIDIPTVNVTIPPRPELSLCEGSVALANGLAFARRQADGAIIGIYPKKPAEKASADSVKHSRRGAMITHASFRTTQRRSAHGSCRCAWRVCLAPVDDPRCARRKKVLLPARRLEDACRGHWILPTRCVTPTRVRSRASWKFPPICQPRCLRTGCNTSERAMWTALRRPQCVPAARS